NRGQAAFPGNPGKGPPSAQRNHERETTLRRADEHGARSERFRGDAEGDSQGGDPPMTPEGRILIIDDEPGVCDVCSLYLRRANFHVECIHQGDMALEAIDRFQPDLVILDLMLPGRDGWDICRAVRERGSLPIIMLTARDDHEDRIQGLELGADDYIVKPFNPRELVARVKAVLRRFRTAETAASA